MMMMTMSPSMVQNVKRVKNEKQNQTKIVRRKSERRMEVVERIAILSRLLKKKSVIQIMHHRKKVVAKRKKRRKNHRRHQAVEQLIQVSFNI